MKKDKNLIFDIGMHKGEDSDFYLKKGFSVVSFEADPDLANYCRKKFANELESGQLTIVEGAITDPEMVTVTDGKVRFYKNNKVSVWGTVVDEWSERNSKLGAEDELIEVSAIDFIDCLNKYGIPYYMKIDIEGMDTVCLKALLNFTEKPDYISIESEKVSLEKLNEELELLTKLGYDHFQAINQSRLSSFREAKNGEGKFLNYQFVRGSSGSFGKDLHPDSWQNLSAIKNQYKSIFQGYKLLGDHAAVNQYGIGRLFSRAIDKFFAYPGWFDTHARHSSVKD